VEDLSTIYEQFGSDRITALAPTSQAGGNMMSSNRLALTAPGSPPVDPLPPAKDQGDPKITATGSVDVGTPAKRKPSGAPAKLNPVPKHANEAGRAGSYDEPSFGRAPGGLGPWKQV
jgi:hypothetical protein